MTWKQARMIAAQHCARLNVPSRLDGVKVQITEYDYEGTDLTLADQRMINQAFEREMRKRGARVQFVPVNVDEQPNDGNDRPDNLRVTMERKNRYVRAARKRKLKLSEWMTETCDKSSGE
jgi:hypothetical protein